MVNGKENNMSYGTKELCHSIDCGSKPKKERKVVALVNLTTIQSDNSQGDYYLCQHCLDWLEGRYRKTYKWRAVPIKDLTISERYKENLKNPKEAITF